MVRLLGCRARLAALAALALMLSVTDGLAQVPMPFLPDTKAAAEAYEARLAERYGGERGDVPALFLEARQALDAGRFDVALPSLEAVATQSPRTYRAWLLLADAWRQSSIDAQQGPAAAWIALTRADGRPQRLDALLALGAIFRDRLQAARAEVAQAQARIDAIDQLRLLRQANPTQVPGGAEFDAQRVLAEEAEARVQAMHEALVAAARIDRIAGDLAEVYDVLRDDLDGPELRELAADETNPIEFQLLEQLGVGTSSPNSERPPDVPAPPREGELPAPPRFDAPEGVAYGRAQTSDAFSQICMRFSLPLNPDASVYERYLVLQDVSDPDAARAIEVPGLRVDADNLCIVGVDAGRNYALTVSVGLPSHLDLELSPRALGALRGIDSASEFTFAVSVPNREQLVGFRGDAFILPQIGEGYVPLYTVNVGEVDLHLLRIADRTLHRHIALGHIGERLPIDEYLELRELFSDELWSGQLTRSFETNATERTDIPVDALLATRMTSGIAADAREAGTELRTPMTLGVELPRGVAQLTGTFRADVVSQPDEAALEGEAGVYALVTEDFIERPEVANSDDPCLENCADYLVQWFVRTDIGLSLYQSDDSLHVVARSLSTGAAVDGADIELVAINNRVLGTETTDANGLARFPARLTRGLDGNALAAVLAHGESDFSFIMYGRDRLDLSRLGVDGRQRARILDAYVYPDRGIYRPGEQIEAAVVMRTPEGDAADIAQPAALVLQSGAAEIARTSIEPSQWQLGGARVTLEVPETARLGTYDLLMLLEDVQDGEALEIGQTVVQIDEFRPDRARLQLVSRDAWDVRATAGNRLQLQGQAYAQYLYGVPPTPEQLAELATVPAEDAGPGLSGSAQRIRGEVEMRLSQAPSPVAGCYAGFSFGPFDAPVLPFLERRVIGHTNDRGLIDVGVASGIALPETQHPLQANLAVTMFDGAGPIATTSDTFLIDQARDWIGVSLQPRLTPPDSGTTDAVTDFGVSFDIVGFDGSNVPLAGRVVEWTVYRERDLFFYQAETGGWVYERDTKRERVETSGETTGRLALVGDLAQGGDGCLVPSQTITLNLPLGRYLLEVTDPATGTVVSTRFVTGSTTADLDDLQPNMLTVTSSADSVEPGASLALNITAPFDGEVLVAFTGEDVVRWVSATTTGRTANISVDIPEDWAGRGLYVLATVFRRDADGSLARGPSRAIGASFFTVTGGDRLVEIALEPPRRVLPQTPFEVPVCVANAGPGGGCDETFSGDGHVMLFAVDEGLLSLTGHASPDPREHFYGQTALPVEIMDSYARLLLRDEGGDRPSRLLLSNYTTDQVVARAFGPFPLTDGQRTITVDGLDMDDGSVRFVAIAWTDATVAAAQATVQVSGAIVARMDTPPFMTPGDEPLVPIRLDNVRGLDGLHELGLDLPGGVTLAVLRDEDGNPIAANAAGRFEIELIAGQPVVVQAALALDRSATADDVTLGLTVRRQGEADDSPTIIRRTRTVGVRQIAPPLLLSYLPPLAGTTDQIDLWSRVQPRIAEDFDDLDSLRIKLQIARPGELRLATLVEEQQRDAVATLDRLLWRGTILMNATVRTDADNAELTSIIGAVQSLYAEYDSSFLPHRVDGTHTADERALLAATDDAASSLEADGMFRTALALDFLTEADRKDFSVSRRILRDTPGVLAREVASASNPCLPGTVYAALVLLPHDRLARSDVEKFLVCATIDWRRETTTPLTYAMIAALLAEFGDDRVEFVLAAYSEAQAPLPSDAMRIAMLANFLSVAGADNMSNGDDLVAPVLSLLQQVQEGGLTLDQAAWMSMIDRAAGASAQDEPPAFALAPAELLDTVERTDRSTVTTGFVSYRELEATGLRVRSEGTEPVTVAVVVEGVPRSVRTLAPLSEFSIRRRFFDFSGAELNGSDLELTVGDVVTVVVEVVGRVPDWRPETLSTVNDMGSIILADPLPAGMEIVVPNAYDPQSGWSDPALPAVGNQRWIERREDRLLTIVQPESAELRKDERPVSGSNTVDVRIAYRARVISAGSFVVPPVIIEALETPSLSAVSPVLRLDVEPEQILR